MKYGKGVIEMTEYSSLEAQAAQHTRQVTELAGKYLSEHSEEAAEALESLYSKTMEYYQQHCNAYEGVLATHAHILALWNVNEYFCPSEAYVYARASEQAFREYLNSEAVRRDPAQQQTAMTFLQNVWLICAYCDYSNDELWGAWEWLKKIPAERASVTDLALTATVLLRLTMEKGINEFYTAFTSFQMMDERFTKPPLQLFEEDIIRTAYGFYYMYYTHDVRDSQGNIPYDPSRAVAILTRAYPLFTDSQQKEFMQKNIDSAMKKLLNGRE